MSDIKFRSIIETIEDGEVTDRKVNKPADLVISIESYRLENGDHISDIHARGSVDGNAIMRFGQAVASLLDSIVKESPYPDDAYFELFLAAFAKSFDVITGQRLFESKDDLSDELEKACGSGCTAAALANEIQNRIHNVRVKSANTPNS